MAGDCVDELLIRSMDFLGQLLVFAKEVQKTMATAIKKLLVVYV